MPVLPFFITAIVPVLLLALVGIAGGIWVWAALAYLSVIAFLADELVTSPLAVTDPEQGEIGANALSCALAGAHFVLLAVAVLAISGATGLGAGAQVAAFAAFGLYFGQVSIANAHELIHRSNRGLFGLGKWVFISLLYGHVTTTHRLLHHPHVATPKDPNFPPLGLSFYRYLPRSLWGNLREGYRIEAARAARTGRANPYRMYLGGALAMLALAYALAGWGGVGALVALGAYAQVQHAMVDYLQHYGLARACLPDGRYAPQGPQHSWNSPHWFTSLMAVNVTRHSDHHAHPARIYPALRLEPGMPCLPYSLPAMGVIALFPRLWFKIMDKRVQDALAHAEGERPCV